jgi:alpha-beta hydrolase superfamily lysophospholipase
MRTILEKSFQTKDGVNVFYRYWPGAGPNAVVLLHRGHEHSGRMGHIPDEIDLPDFSFFAWDARAHGNSGGVQDANTTMATFSADLDEFVRHIEAAHGIATTNIAIVAQSVGAVIAAAWVHDYAPQIRCQILASPAFKVKLFVPFARRSLALWHQVYGDFFVNSYVQPGMLTHDAERAASYTTDKLIKRPISARVLLGLYKTAERLIDDAAAINVPTQLLVSGSDWVVHERPQFRFYERLGTQNKEYLVFPGFFHDTLGEKNRAKPLKNAREFILAQFERPFAPLSLRNADKRGFTKDEYDEMSLPACILSPRSWGYAMQRISMKTGGRLSEGISLGLRTGFDSGATLDYVYRNQPSGVTPIGKIVDKGYLDAIGWRGIRIRKKHVEASIAEAAAALRAKGGQVRIVDIAAGHGRYVLDAVGRVNPDHILLRDYDPSNVESGRSLIAERKLKAEFQLGDAFNRASLASVKATLGIVSGLYELFPDNAAIETSLAGMADAIEPGGFIIYTGQPWHPQLEMIARTLTSLRDGKPWIMRRRTQAELDELVRNAGFRKTAQRIDEFGIFTVSIAERVNA